MSEAAVMLSKIFYITTFKKDSLIIALFEVTTLSRDHLSEAALPRVEPIPMTLPRLRLPLHHKHRPQVGRNKPAIAKMLNRSQVYLKIFNLEH